MFSYDWGQISIKFDEIAKRVKRKNLIINSEAQTRFEVIDGIIRDVLQWQYGQISIEEFDQGEKNGYVDYILRNGDVMIVIEAKKIGASFPTPTKNKKLKLDGVVLSDKFVSAAIEQANRYAKNKNANLAAVTNGFCWVVFLPFDEKENKDAYLFFPFENENKDAEELFKGLSRGAIDGNGLQYFIEDDPAHYPQKLLQQVYDEDARIDRNNVADYISSAVNSVFSSPSLFDDLQKLESCFVSTDARIKYDRTLRMAITESKPAIITPAERIRRTKESPFKKIINNGSSSSSQLTLLIGSVGSGKSTYLKHFEMIEGRKIIDDRDVYWAYIDFKKMSKERKPRDFIYSELYEYLMNLNQDKEDGKNYAEIIEPAYKQEVAILKKATWVLIPEEKIKEKMFDLIESDREKIFPFVDKIIKYLSRISSFIIVLDNIDLYEDDDLEISVFSEGLSLASNLRCHAMVSIRDTTFIKHKNDAVFDPYEFRKFWLDPPSFREVLSKRLIYAQQICANKTVKIPMNNGGMLNVPDIGQFFEIVRQSLLGKEAEGGVNVSDFLEAMSNRDIRRGLLFVKNFLDSGHIQADLIIKNYFNTNTKPTFPFHEIFKGTMLGQWRYYKEGRAELLNLFDYKFSKNLQLLKLLLLKYLMSEKQKEQADFVAVSNIIEVFTVIGASPERIIQCLNKILSYGLIKNEIPGEVLFESKICINRNGGYYITFLVKRFEYLEMCIMDTLIYDDDKWKDLVSVTREIEQEHNLTKRLVKRRKRINIYFDYLANIENDNISLLGHGYLRNLPQIAVEINKHLDEIAIPSSIRLYGN